MHLRLTTLCILASVATGCSWMDTADFWQRGRWTPQHHTLKELRDLHVIKQERDYSCGAAALATLMIYYFGEATSEQDILNLLHKQLTDEEQKKKSVSGFSLLDLKRVAETKGYRAAGFQLTPSQLAQLAAPVIVFVEPFGYKHFAVYRGMFQGRIYLADPSRGNLRMSLDRFLDEWSGIVFVLSKPGEEFLTEYPLQVHRPSTIQPELGGLPGILDLEMLTRTLPQR